MSYAGFPGYGTYYDTLPTDSDTPSGYDNARAVASSTHGNAAGYQIDTQSNQRVPQDYAWPNHSHQEYNSAADQPSYPAESWKGGNSQRNAYDHQRQQATFKTSNTAPEDAAQGYYGTTSKVSKPAGTQALSSLAYASGLESAGMQNGGCRVQRTSTPTATSTSQNTGMGHQRFNSQVQNLLVQHTQPQNISWDYQNTGQSDVSYPTTGYRSKSQEDLTVAAAAALTEAVRQKYPNINHTSRTISPQSMSTAMGSTQSLAAAGQPGSQYAVQPATHASRQQQNQTRESSSPAAQNTRHPTATRAPAPQAILREALHQVTPNSGTNPTSVCSSAQQTGSIANLVTHEAHAEKKSATSHAASIEASSMPNYINPSAIFNPYQREHERAKREAEAVAKQEAESAAKKMAEEAKLVAVAAAVAPERQSPSSNASNVPPRKSRAKSHTATANHRVNDPKRAAAPPEAPAWEEDMAAELKAMMDKMKTFKDKDPKLFQKLWENMRQPAPAASSAPVLTSFPAAPTSTPAAAPHADVAPTTPIATTSSGATHGSSYAADTLPGIPANGYKVVVEDNPKGLPDLGRFPAERRIRASYKKPQGNGQEQGDPTASSMEGVVIHSGEPKNQVTAAPVPSSQPLPPRTALGSVIWPEAKRSALAEAAISALRAYPENTIIPLKAKDIHDMLNQNPSYIDLCFMLERRGFRFDRGSFARYLLRSVPQLSSGQQPRGTPPLLKQESTTPSVDRIKSLPSAEQGDGNPGLFASRKYMLNGLPPNGSRQSPIINHQPPKTGKPRLGVPASPIPAPAPGSKEAQARKRDFSELIDLTELGDDDNYVMPTKQPRLESPDPEIEDLFRGFKSPQQAQSSGTFGVLHNAGLSLLPRNVTPLKFDPSTTQCGIITPSQKPRIVLTRSLNKAEALRKSYYDPKKVARDVLIAAGRHPFERPLNAHMAGLLGRYIELDSDLTTFNWEEVDPGGPPPPKVAYVDVPAAPPRYQLGERLRHHAAAAEPQRREESRHVAPKEDKPDANSWLQTRAQSFNKLASQAQSLLQQPSQPQPEVTRRPPRLRHSVTVEEDVPTKPAQTLTPRTKKIGSAKSTSPDTLLRAVRSSSPPEEKKPVMDIKRRGRPPGAKNKNSPISGTKPMASRGVQVVIPMRTQSRVSTFPIFKCKWRLCGTELHNLTTLKKHVVKVHNPEDPTQAVCWWKKCPLMRKDDDGTITADYAFDSHSSWLDHIDKEHLDPLGAKLGSGPNTSHIGKQPDFDVSKFTYDPSSIGQVTRIPSHLDPQTIAQDRKKYLADEYGRTTTYPATPAANEGYDPDTVDLTNVTGNVDHMSPLKSFLKQHGNEKLDPKLSAEQTMSAMQAHKAKIGPGLDRGGCTLVNEARRATLLHSPGIARVVDEQY